MIRVILLIVVCAGVLNACIPELPPPVATALTTEVYGRVVQRDTEQRATSDSLVIRAYYEYTKSTGGLTYVWITKLMAETKTDTNGFYYLKFEADDLERHGYYFTLESNIPNHFEQTPGDWLKYGLNPGQSQQKKIQMTPFAWLRIKTRNIDSWAGDRLTLHFNNANSFQIWGPVEREFTIQVFGNWKNFISSSLTRNGVITNTNFEVYAPAFDTTDFLIEY